MEHDCMIVNVTISYHYYFQLILTSYKFICINIKKEYIFVWKNIKLNIICCSCR
jgi:hypothetical protein